MRVCATKGCPKLTRATRCEGCEAAYQKHRSKVYDAGRPAPAQRGYGERHREWRGKILARDPFCKWPGCIEPSTVADHITPIREGGLRFKMENGQGMCERHHNAKRQQESLRARGHG